MVSGQVIWWRSWSARTHLVGTATLSRFAVSLQILSVWDHSVDSFLGLIHPIQSTWSPHTCGSAMGAANFTHRIIRVMRSHSSLSANRKRCQALSHGSCPSKPLSRMQKIASVRDCWVVESCACAWYKLDTCVTLAIRPPAPAVELFEQLKEFILLLWDGTTAKLKQT